VIIMPQGQTKRLAVVLLFDQPDSIQNNAATLLQYASPKVNETSTAWNNWLNNDTIFGEAKDSPLLTSSEKRLLARSLSTLRLMRNETVATSDAAGAIGSIVASPNLQPMYWPVWPRDGVFQGLAWQMAGRPDYAHDMLEWCFRETTETPIRRTPCENWQEGDCFEDQSAWIQCYDPINGNHAGLPGVGIFAASAYLDFDWSHLLVNTQEIDDLLRFQEVTEFDQPPILLLGVKSFYEGEGHLPDGVSWGALVKASRFILENLQDRDLVGSENNLFLPTSIDWGEDPRFDVGLSSWANMAALGGLQAVAALFTDGIDNDHTIDDETRADMQDIVDEIGDIAPQLRAAINTHLWRPGNILLTKIYPKHPRDLLNLLPPGTTEEIWTACKADTLVRDPSDENDPHQLAFSLYKAQTMHIWPFGADGPADGPTKEFWDNRVALHYDLPLDLQNGLVEPRRVWSVPYLGCGIYERLLYEAIGDTSALTLSKRKLTNIIGDYYRMVDQGRIPNTSYLTDAGYIPDVLIAGYPGAMSGSKPLGWTHAMAVMALLQKAGYELPLAPD